MFSLSVRPSSSCFFFPRICHMSLRRDILLSCLLVLPSLEYRMEILGLWGSSMIVKTQKLDYSMVGHLLWGTIIWKLGMCVSLSLLTAMNFYSKFSFSPPLKLKIAPSHQVNLQSNSCFISSLHNIEFVVFIVVFGECRPWQSSKCSGQRKEKPHS